MFINGSDKNRRIDLKARITSDKRWVEVVLTFRAKNFMGVWYNYHAYSKMTGTIGGDRLRVDQASFTSHNYFFSLPPKRPNNLYDTVSGTVTVEQQSFSFPISMDINLTY